MFENGLSPYLKNIRVSLDGKSVTLTEGTDPFKEAVKILDDLFRFSRDTAPFSVCLPEEVEKMSDDGLWIELMFGEKMSAYGFTYDSLLMSIATGRKTFTMIRHTGDGYGGRCLSVETDGTSDILYEYMKNIVQ